MKRTLRPQLGVLAVGLIAFGLKVAHSGSGRMDYIYTPGPPVYTATPPGFPVYPPDCIAGQATHFGDPLPGLTPAQLAIFIRGSNQFATLEGVADGLGPIFNAPADGAPVKDRPTAVSCALCHSFPAAGGIASLSETRFGRITSAGFDPLLDLGGSLLQTRATNGGIVETNPAPYLPGGVTALRQITPVFGAGLIEAIEESTIILNAARSRGDGVNGKVAYLRDLGSTNAYGTNPVSVGRFGWKAQVASLRRFSGDAYANEMDISNPVFPFENLPNQAARRVPFASLKDKPDATGKTDVERFTDFMRLLAPPPALPLTNYSTIHGAMLFTTIGCARCHTPVLFTGPNTNAALAFKPVRLFSDLVLHDMGSLNDNIGQGAADTNQMRTPPLFGVRVRGELGLGRLNHDGQSTNMVQAISRHGGEGKKARDRFLNLKAGDQNDLVNFLNTL